MDLNQLFADHQGALLRARRAACPAERQSQLDLAQTCERQMRRFRSALGLPRYEWA